MKSGRLELKDEAGVYYDEAQDKWCARIGRDRGWFDTAEEAYAAFQPSSAQRSMQEELSKLGLIWPTACHPPTPPMESALTAWWDPERAGSKRNRP